MTIVSNTFKIIFNTIGKFDRYIPTIDQPEDQREIFITDQPFFEDI